MTSLQNGNYNSRSMNGLTTIYANDITTDVINAVDANVSNDLTVGDQAIINGQTKLYNDLLIYDKSSPTKFPYRFTTTGSSLFFSYDGTTPRALFDISLNTVSGFPELNMRRVMNLYNNFQLNNNLEFRLGTFGGSTYAFMRYTESTRNLNLVAGQGGGSVDSQFNLTTNTAAGSPFILSFNPTQLTVPTPIIQTISTGTPNSLKETTIIGTKNIQLIPRTPTGADPSLTNALVFSEGVTASGSAGFFMQTASGSDLINFGCNAWYFGGRNTAKASGNIRFDTRNTGTSHIIQFRIERPGTTAASELVWACDEPTSRNINYLNSEYRLKGLYRDTITPFTNYTEISKIGADLQIEGIHNSSTLKVVNRNAGGTISTTFQNSTATTDITSTNINLNGAVATTTNNITQTTGIISQSGAGTNLMKAITLNVDNNFLQSGTGIITQTGTVPVVNTLKETTFTGTDPIYVVPNVPVGATNVRNAIFLTDNVASGRGGFINQLASGFNFISVGVNAAPFGNRVNAQAGAVIRFDTRDNGTLTGDPIASFRIWKRGFPDTQLRAMAIFEAERIVNSFDTQFARKTLFQDTITPFTNFTEISKIGADLQIEGTHNSSTLKVVNRNAGGTISTTFQNSTATTDITSTNINLNGTTTIANNTNFVLQDGSIQNTAYQEAELSDTYFHSKVSGRNILCSSFNMADNPNTGAFTGLGTTTYFFYPMKVVKNVSYTGVGILAGTTGSNNWEIALYQGFVNNPALLKTTGTVSSTGGVMNYYAFTGGAYVPTATDIVYVGLRNLTAGHSAYFLPANTYMSYASAPVMTNGTLNKRGQSTPGSVAFPANLGAGAVMTINTVLPYLVFYN